MARPQVDERSVSVAQAAPGARARLGLLARYLLSGGSNTLVTWLVYWALLRWLDYRVAYVIAFVLGIGLSFALLRLAVFQRAGRPHSWLYVALSYLVQLGLGLGVVELWVRGLGGAPWLAPVVSVVVCLPLMFAFHRWVFSPPAHSEAP